MILGTLLRALAYLTLFLAFGFGIYLVVVTALMWGVPS